MDDPRLAVERSLNALDRTVGDAVTFFRSRTDDGAPTEDDGDAWGPKQVLSHLLFWHDWTLRSLRNVAAGQPALRQPPTRAEVDQWNAQAVAERADRETAVLANELADLQRQLVATVRSLPDPQAIVAVRGDGTELSVAERLAMMNHHFANHLAELRQTRESRPANNEV